MNTTLDALVAAITAGEIRTAARLISRIERGEGGLTPLLKALYLAGGRSRIVGVTGPPGAGKSTLCNQLVAEWRQRGLRVAVLAVDPSSPFSGGAVLGDRLRMSKHSCDDDVFIRSMASRGMLGGLAKAAGDALTVLDAMPWDVVLIETVGVGQNETDIMRHASVVLLLQTPMGGDDVQAAKAGIIEIGDIFVVNKGDHPDADRTVRQLEQMILMRRRMSTEETCLPPTAKSAATTETMPATVSSPEPWWPPVLKTQALNGSGVAALADQIDRRFAFLAAHSEAASKKQHEQAKYRVGEIMREMMDRRIRADGEQWLDGVLDPVVLRQSDPFTLAASLLDRIA